MPTRLGRAEGMDWGCVAQVFTDGGLLSANPSLVGGTWSFCFVDAEDRFRGGAGGIVLASEVFGNIVSNNTSEFLAMLLAVEQLPDGWSGDLFTDNETCRARFANPFACGTVGLPGAWVQRLEAAMRRLGTYTMHLLGGHPTRADLIAGVRAKDGFPVSKFNVWCDKQCEEQSKRWKLEQAAAAATTTEAVT